MRALIVDDEAPARAKIRHWLRETPDIHVVAEASDGINALRAVEMYQPDLMLLDIQMPALTGLEVAAHLDSETAPMIVFVTAFEEHAISAFDLNAVDYLLKPYDNDRFSRMLDRVRRETLRRDGAKNAITVARTINTASKRLVVPDGSTLRPIPAHDVHWLEAEDNYVRVHTKDRAYFMRRTLQDLLAQLGQDRFVRIHKSLGVNTDEIESLSPLLKGDFDIHLRSGKRLRLSRRYRNAIPTRFNG